MENFIFCAVSIKNKGNFTSKYSANFATAKFYHKICESPGFLVFSNI